MRKSLVLLAATLLAHCGPAPDDRQPVCIDDGHQDGPPCLERIETREQFESISLEGMRPPGIEYFATKFMLPVDNQPELLPLVFQNSKRYKLHICFMCCAFPDLYGPCDCIESADSCPSDGGLTPSEYMKMILTRETRSYFAGSILGFDDPVKGRIYGIDIWTEQGNSAEILEMKEVREVYEAIQEGFLPEALAYYPSSPQAIAKAQSWIDPDFPVYLDLGQEVNTEVYTPGTAYGTVRLFTISELDQAIRQGELGWQDIVVVDQVPFDIEAVVAGVITGGRQWELSHVNVRMARRGTPNLYVRDPLETLAGYDNQLVKLEAVIDFSRHRYVIDETTLAEAEAWWAEHRPDIGPAPAVDRDYREFDDLLAMDTDDQPVPLISRFGGKAANLAKLFDILPEPYRVPGFGIPFAYFEDFMQDNTILDQRLQPPEEVSYREYVGRLVADQRFRTEAAYRRELLWDLRTRMEQPGQVNPQVVAELVARIREVFGGTGIKVRFRSSSNVEDALEFSGAGLYSSTSVCADDSLDQDLNGPSRCDLTQDSERSIERGLARVWASLYNARAWEEREWYQVPQEQASMAILVSLAFSDEQANGVAFTGNPARTSDNRYMINVQLGDPPVVGNDPRMVPEQDFLAVDPETGQVTNIYRSRSSALAEPGVYVLSDDQLAELGQLIFTIERDLPLDSGDYLRTQVLLDLEFKIDRQGDLRIKQIRPYLDENKCRKIACDQPPDDYCQDANTLTKYSAWGLCDSDSGDCDYQTTETHCQNGCLNGACQ